MSVSPSAARFKQVVGQSSLEYAAHMASGESKAETSESNLPFMDIAQEVGSLTSLL
jgi:hypothetical protein